MRPLIIGDQEKAHLQAMKEFAHANVFTIEQMRSRSALKAKGEYVHAPGDFKRYSCILPLGFKVVYTVEEATRRDSNQVVQVRHLSVSLLPFRKGKVPHTDSVQMIMEELGFRGNLNEPSEMHVYIEDEYEAINVMEQI